MAVTESITAAPTDFWRGKKVLITGHTGFKGSWLSLWLNRLGADLTGISLAPPAGPNLYSLANVQSVCLSHYCDIRSQEQISTIIHKARPEVVFHLAAQPLVRYSYRHPLETFSTNVQGTAIVLDALRQLDSIRTIVVVTTDKIYRNLEQIYPFRETDPLGGHDPYSASKAAAEIVVASYKEAFFAARNIGIASARAGNVIGGGDWSEDRLVPDAVKAWSRGEVLRIRHPLAVRPWQHVLEPLAGYLRLAEHLWRQPAISGAYNFGPETHEVATVKQVVELAREAFGEGQVEWEIDNAGLHEASRLSLEVSKVRDVLKLNPCWTLAEAVGRTMVWYRQQLSGCDGRELCEADITSYETGVKESVL